MTPEEMAHAAALPELEPPAELRRHLSWFRVLAVLVVVLLAGGAVVGFRSGSSHGPTARPSSSFAPYVDVTATPQYAFESATQTPSSNFVLGFVVSAKGASCQPSWGAAYSLDAASDSLDLDRRIARLRQQDGQVSVSFGGVANSELAIGCTDATQLAAAYKSVVDRYSSTGIDLDIEGAAASAADVDARRAQAIASVQHAEQSAGRALSVWLTLPVAPSGLTETGLAVLDSMLAAHVSVTGVNALTMDYGQPLATGQTMAGLAESSLTAVAKQLRTAYGHVGTSLSLTQAWQHLGATPMIGQNDTPSERFELADAKALLAFGEAHHLRRLSMWSANRDQSCGPNYANVEVVSPNCSGASQAANAYSKIFDTFSSRGSVPIGGADDASPTPNAAAAAAPDDPATSPYAIWNPAQSYPAGTKIVWHHNVYQAKWYTQDVTPDAPVANASDTPWTLIGPVLPGEHPVPTPTLPAGTYPTWSATTVYVAGDRVLYHSVGFQAKWYTQGDVPGEFGTASSPSPWEQLTS